MCFYILSCALLVFMKFVIERVVYLQSRDQDYIPDAYDELLTQAEIQGHITYVNGKDFCELIFPYSGMLCKTVIMFFCPL